MHVCIAVSVSASVSSTVAASVRYYDWAALCAASLQATKNNNNNNNKTRKTKTNVLFVVAVVAVDCRRVCLDSPLPFIRERKIRFK